MKRIDQHAEQFLFQFISFVILDLLLLDEKDIESLLEIVAIGIKSFDHEGPRESHGAKLTSVSIASLPKELSTHALDVFQVICLGHIVTRLSRGGLGTSGDGRCSN